MSRIPDSTQVSVTWKQPHTAEQKHLAEVVARGHVVGMTREGAAQVIGELQDLKGQLDQRLAEQARRFDAAKSGRILDVFA